MLPDDITAMERMDYKMRSFKAVIIALANNEVRVYKDKFIVNTFKVDVSYYILTLLWLVCRIG